MKLKNIKSLTLAICLVNLFACSKDSPIDSSKSVVITEPVVSNKFDKWLEHSILEPYNIDLRYKIKDNETSMNYHLAPAEFEKSIRMAHLVKYLCLEAYDEATGSQQFVRSLFPKIVDLIGSPAYNTNGTIVLGTAEGGRKMTLYNVNNLDPSKPESLNELYFKTVHHEFGHIQNQTKAYPKEFQQITANAYVSDSWSKKWDKPEGTKDIVLEELKKEHAKGAELLDLYHEYSTLSKKKTPTVAERTRLKDLQNTIREHNKNPEYRGDLELYLGLVRILDGLNVSQINALRAGFVSPYASSQHGEDFVEVQSIFMTDAPEVWAAKLAFAGASGRELIQAKYAIVESYLSKEWGLNLVQLRDIVQKRQAKLKEQNLDDLTVKSN